VTNPDPERTGRYAFASPAEAVAALLECLSPVATECIPLELAAGRVLAESIVTDRPSPAADVSAMDGYAVRIAAMEPGEIRVVGEVRIGRRPPELPAGRQVALRIVTGAPVPPGADAVVKREDVQEHGDHIAISADALAALRPGLAIRRRGENAPTGAQVAGAGTPISPPVAAALALFGCESAAVHRKVRVGVLVTGDELVRPGTQPTEWELRDSNGPALMNFLSVPAWIQPQDGGPRRAVDDPGAVKDAIATLLAACDAVLITGGVSMGDRDFVPGALAALGARVIFHRLPQRPGKPVLAATMSGGQPVLALPGNPVSVMVTARRIAAPVLRRLAGFTVHPPPPLVRIQNADAKQADLWWHRPVRLTAPGMAELVPLTGSGDVPSVAESDGFVELPPGESGEGPRAFYGWSL
jgi:molybdopterin molybdotransferase